MSGQGIECSDSPPSEPFPWFRLENYNPESSVLDSDFKIKRVDKLLSGRVHDGWAVKDKYR